MLRAQGFHCGAMIDPPGHEWNNFTHEANELVAVVEGRMRFTLLDEAFELEPGGGPPAAAPMRRRRLHGRRLVPGATPPRQPELCNPARWDTAGSVLEALGCDLGPAVLGGFAGVELMQALTVGCGLQPSSRRAWPTTPAAAAALPFCDACSAPYRVRLPLQTRFSSPPACRTGE